MYEGPTGERYTLYCAQSDLPESALRYRAAGAVAAYYWIDDNRAYVVSGPADRDRLLKVAQSAYDQLEGRAKSSRSDEALQPKSLRGS
jgi:anti-sigma factor RsiW